MSVRHNQNRPKMPKGLEVQISFAEYVKIIMENGEEIEIHLLSRGIHSCGIKFKTKRENKIIRETYDISKNKYLNEESKKD